MGCQKEKEGTTDQEVANVVHAQEVAGKSSTSNLGSAFRAHNLCIEAFQELTCIYQGCPPTLTPPSKKNAEIILRLPTKYKLSQK